MMRALALMAESVVVRAMTGSFLETFDQIRVRRPEFIQDGTLVLVAGLGDESLILSFFVRDNRGGILRVVPIHPRGEW